MRRVLIVLTLLLLLVSNSNAAQSGKLTEIMQRGRLICGVNAELPGFGWVDPDTDEFSGFDVDFCRALAAAIFGTVTEDNLEFVALTAELRFEAVQSGAVDVLIRNTTLTFGRDVDYASDFGPVIFYDGQGLMAHSDVTIQSSRDLNGAVICATSGTTNEENLRELFDANGLQYTLLSFEETSATFDAFVRRDCDLLTSDRSQLASLRSETPVPSNYQILPYTLSKEPLAPLYLADEQWGNIIRWVIYATFYAEELGITSQNIDQYISSPDPSTQRFLGGAGDMGRRLGLSDDFVVSVIRAVGNYGEIYARHLEPLGIVRDDSLNAQWYNGGLIYAPPWN